MGTFFIGTANQGKIKEIRLLLADVPHTFLFLSDFPALAEPAETGNTFTENAIIKATYYAQAIGLPTLSEDSGLVVHALHGFPGINSNRWYAGTDEARNWALLEKMNQITARGAHYFTVVALVNPNETKPEGIFTGEVAGSIAPTPSGEAGFGYDPIFIPEGENTTIAELGIDYKNQHSARSKSWGKVAQFLAKIPT